MAARPCLPSPATREVVSPVSLRGACRETAAWSTYERPEGASQETVDPSGHPELPQHGESSVTCAASGRDELSVPSAPLVPSAPPVPLAAEPSTCTSPELPRPAAAPPDRGLHREVCLSRWCFLHRWIRLSCEVVPPCAQSSTWSTSHRSARREHPGKRHVSSRIFSYDLRSAGTVYLSRPTERTAPVSGWVSSLRNDGA